MSAGARRAPLGPAQRTTVPSAYVRITSKVSRSACGSGPMERVSRAGPGAPPGIRIQVTALATSSTRAEWMPARGSSSLREVIRGAQPVTDIG